MAIDVARSGSKIKLSLTGSKPFYAAAQDLEWGFFPATSVSTAYIRGLKGSGSGAQDEAHALLDQIVNGELRIPLSNLTVGGVAPSTEANAQLALEAVFLDGVTGYSGTVSPYTNPLAPYEEIFALNPGVLSDGLIPFTKVGNASTSSVLAKSGNFDKLTVTGGDHTSYLTFDHVYICDESAVIKAKIRVDDLNKNGSSGTSWLGLGGHGVQELNDTGSPFDHLFAIEMIGRTGARQGNGGVATTGFTIYSSGETLVANGDVLELEYRNNLAAGFKMFRIVNKRTGAFVVFIASGLSAVGAGMINSTLRLVVGNVSATVFALQVHYANPLVKPLLHKVGDSMTNSYDIPIDQGLYSVLVKRGRYYYVNSCGNGAYLHTIANKQLQDVARTKPIYTLFVSILVSFWGHFVAGNANNADFTFYWTKIMTFLVGIGTIPVIVCFQEQGYGNAAAWLAFVTAQKAGPWPQIRILDLTNANLQLSAQFGHPSAQDEITIANNLFTQILNPDGVY